MDQQSARKVAVGLLESTKEEEEMMMSMYNQKIGEEELQGVGVDNRALCFDDDFDCDKQHEELHEAVCQPWMTVSLP